MKKTLLFFAMLFSVIVASARDINTNNNCVVLDGQKKECKGKKADCDGQKKDCKKVCDGKKSCGGCKNQTSKKESCGGCKNQAGKKESCGGCKQK